jgi:TonB-dependent starch-binding outer membrane protein SusC
MRNAYSRMRYVKLSFAFLLSGICMMSSAIAYAGDIGRKPSINFADQTITGTIRDASGNPLAGATVAEKGSTRNTVTDINGSFSITVFDSKSVLVISYVGFTSQEVTVGSNSSLTITLQPAQGELQQVVVVGYGTQNKRDVTGAVKSIRAESFNKGIVNTPQQLLQGKVSGVNVTSSSGEPGSNLAITIRGPGGLRTGNTPLFVIDGLPLDNSGTGGGDALNFINPQDIESMDVLKDASATAIYGSRGANGVVLITTKKGKGGSSIVTYSGSVGISKLARKMPVFSADEFRKQVVAVGGVLDEQGGNTDWQKEITRTAYTYNHNLTLSGGSDKFTYYASFGYQNQEGIIKANDLKTYSGRMNATQKLWDGRLVIDVNLNATQTKNNRPPIQGMIGDALANNPTYPAYGSDGKPALYQNINNPLLTYVLDKDIATVNRVLASISPSLTIIKGLVYKLNFGVDNSNANRDFESLPFAEPQRDGRLETYYTYNRNSLIENYLTYTTKIGDHNISVLGGHSFQKIFLQGRNNSINRFPIDQVEPIYNPGYGQELTLAANKPGGYAVKNELQSFFARVNYQYHNKYLATINFRTDGSTKFGANNKYGYFPSFSLGWKISEESFMDNSFFSNLKLRGGWGITGNQEIGSKETQALYTTTVSASSSYPLYPTGPYPAGTTFSRLANPDLQWETSKQTNIGLDFGLFKDALSGSINVFKKVSSNILLRIPPADPIQPADNLYSNVKDMTITNSGIELELDYRHKSNKDFSYSIGGNATFIKNNVEKSPYTVIITGNATGSGLTSANLNGYLNGSPIGTFYLLNFLGIGNDSLSIFEDRDKDGIISDKDRIAAGSALPKVIYSFYGSASYKGFDFTASFNGTAGNKIYDNTANAFFYKAKIAKNVNTTSEAIQFPNESINNPAGISTRYLKNGSYLRLNNVVLGYTFNTNSIGIKKWVSALRLSLTAQNLFVITDYDGYDPEVNTDRSFGGVYSYGIDYLSYPKARSIIFGLNLSF